MSKKKLEYTIASSKTGNSHKKLVIKSVVTAEGKLVSTIVLYKDYLKIDEFWGLPKAIEEYNKL